MSEEKKWYKVVTEFTRPPQEETLLVGADVKLTDEEAAELGDKVELVETEVEDGEEE